MSLIGNSTYSLFHRSPPSSISLTTTLGFLPVKVVPLQLAFSDNLINLVNLGHSLLSSLGTPPILQSSKMDRQSVYSVSVFQSGAGAGDDTRLQIQENLVTFILQFRHDNSFIYRDQLRENALLKKYYCDVNITDLITYNEELAHRLVTEPAEIIPLVCSLYLLLPLLPQYTQLTSFYIVRISPQEMHSPHYLPPRPQGRRTRTSTPPPF